MLKLSRSESTTDEDDRMKKAIVTFLSLAVLATTVGCGEWVAGVEDPIDAAPEENLTRADRLDFLLTGVKGTFAETHDQVTVLADGLSDQQVFDRNLPQATFPSYDRLESGQPNLDDGTVNDDLGELRFYSDNLIAKVNEIGDVASEFEDVRQEALFYGYFMGGVARGWYASYMGLQPTEGGGVIDNGPFIPSSAMYDSAVARIEQSLDYATPYQTRVVHSTLARLHTYAGEYQEALQAAQMGLEPGDPPFNSLHNSQSSNEWFFAANEGRVQWRANERFPGYVDDNPEESSRLPMFTLEGRAGTAWSIQDKYDTRDAPITFIDWQENHLLLAENGLRTGDSSVDPEALVNEVRDSHGISPVSSVDMQVIIEERDKELFARGQRLIDQRRFDLWHMGPETWQYFPISQNERNNNPNIN